LDEKAQEEAEKNESAIFSHFDLRRPGRHDLFSRYHNPIDQLKRCFDTRHRFGYLTVPNGFMGVGLSPGPDPG
jgi:hypothetical protein